MTRSAPRTVLVWTENYAVGGCDRFLVDLANGLDPARWNLVFAGNRCAAFDEYLTTRREHDSTSRITPRLVTIPALHRTATNFADGIRGSRPTRSATTQIEELAARSNPPPWFTAARYVSGITRVGTNFLNRPALRRVLRTVRPEIVHINNGGYPGGETCREISWLARREGARRIVHFVHNTAQPLAVPRRVEAALDRRIDRAIDGWATAAHATSRDLANVRGIPERRIRTVHYGLPELANAPHLSPALTRSELGVPADVFCIAMVANYEVRKGHAVLFEALRALRPESFVCLLMGDGPRRPAMERLAAEAGLGSSIRFLGWRDDVDELLRLSDVLVLPSLRDECLPYVILEAMQQGLPAISTRVAGIPEQIENGVSGFVVEPGDPAALGAALSRLADPELRGRMGARARERQRRQFSLELMVAHMTELWTGFGNP